MSGLPRPKPPVFLEAQLALKLLETLREGGERKISVLRALALHWGYAEDQFDIAIQLLRSSQLVRRRISYGGPRYACR